MGFPAMMARDLPGKREEANRAGITPRILVGTIDHSIAGVTVRLLIVPPVARFSLLEPPSTCATAPRCSRAHRDGCHRIRRCPAGPWRHPKACGLFYLSHPTWPRDPPEIAPLGPSLFAPRHAAPSGLDCPVRSRPRPHPNKA